MAKVNKSFEQVNVFYPDEIVDIVNAEDIVISQILKIDAHKKGLLHRCVLGQVIDSKGRRLLVRQSSSMQDPGQFVLPIGGHIQAGESEVEALTREAEEELGFRSEFKCEYLGKMIYERKVLGRQENHYFIIYLVFSDQMPILGREADQFDYFSPQSLKKLLRKKPEMFGTPMKMVYKQFFPEFFS